MKKERKKKHLFYVFKVFFNKCLNLRSGLSLLLYVGEKWDIKMQCCCVFWLLEHAMQLSVSVCDKHDDCICRPSCILNVRKCTQKLNNKHTVFLHSRSNRKICILKRENENTGKLALFQNHHTKQNIYLHFLSIPSVVLDGMSVALNLSQCMWDGCTCTLNVLRFHKLYYNLDAYCLEQPLYCFTR